MRLERDRVVIERTGAFARVRQGARVEVPLSDITGVHLQEPKMGFRGFVQLLIGGEPATTWVGVNQHPRALYFDSASHDEFTRIRSAIEMAAGVRLVERREDLEAALGIDEAGNPLGPPDADGERVAEEIAAKGIQSPVVLVITANPRFEESDALLQVDREERAIREALERTAYGRKFDLQTRPAESPHNFGHHLLETTPTILHLSGHGAVRGFVMEDEDRRPVLVNPEGLALFARSKPIARNLRVIVLNACLSQAQAKYLAKDVNVVIGISDEIEDAAATAFAAQFYGGLGQGTSVGDAFDIAVAQVALLAPHQASLFILETRPGVDAAEYYPLRL